MYRYIAGLSAWATGTLAMAASAAVNGSTRIPYLSEEAQAGPSLQRLLIVLVVCAAVGAGWVLLHRQGLLPGRREARLRRIEVLEVQALDTKSRLVLVRYDNRQLLLARSETGVTLLHQDVQERAP